MRTAELSLVASEQQATPRKTVCGPPWRLSMSINIDTFLTLSISPKPLSPNDFAAPALANFDTFAISRGLRKYRPPATTMKKSPSFNVRASPLKRLPPPVDLPLHYVRSCLCQVTNPSPRTTQTEPEMTTSVAAYLEVQPRDPIAAPPPVGHLPAFPLASDSRPIAVIRGYSRLIAVTKGQKKSFPPMPQSALRSTHPVQPLPVPASVVSRFHPYSISFFVTLLWRKALKHLPRNSLRSLLLHILVAEACAAPPANGVKRFADKWWPLFLVDSSLKSVHDARNIERNLSGAQGSRAGVSRDKAFFLSNRSQAVCEQQPTIAVLWFP
jgi:hypothetical protein